MVVVIFVVKLFVFVVLVNFMRGMRKKAKEGMTLLSVMIFGLASMMILVSMFSASTMGRRINIRGEDAHATFLVCRQEIDRLEELVENGGISALLEFTGGQPTIMTNYVTSFHRSGSSLNNRVSAQKKVELIPGVTAGCSNLTAVVSLEWMGMNQIRARESVMAVFYKY